MKPTIKAIIKGAAIGLTAVAIAIAISSCGIPLKASIVGHYGVYSFSSKSGLEAQIHIEK